MMLHKLLPGLLCVALFSSCAVFKGREWRKGRKIEREVLRSPVFSRAFTGFVLMDPLAGKVLADFQGDRYFTPASNVKILTLATCLEILRDSVPGVQYVYAGDSLIFRGAADPAFLHPDFAAWQPWWKILRNTRHSLFYDEREFDEPRFGAGWAWDDYNEDYQMERSAMPLYGNAIRLTLNRTDARVEPPFFQPNVVFQRPGALERLNGITRTEHNNVWMIPESVQTAHAILPVYNPNPARLLSDTLQRAVGELQNGERRSWKTFYSTPLDTVLRRMMYQSDNFVAEQLLLACAGEKWGLLQQDTLMQWMLDSVWQLPQRPRWVDGSGLSRYNLVSPLDLSQVLLRMWKMQPPERLLPLFPAGGVQGTLQDWYAGENGKAYVFAKTGSMSGVHCLSGYVRCNSGNVLIFSFMHNHFVGSNRDWKTEMQRILEMIRDEF